MFFVAYWDAIYPKICMFSYSYWDAVKMFGNIGPSVYGDIVISGGGNYL